LALAAMLMTALTIGVTVLWPAYLGAQRGGAAILAASSGNSPTASKTAADTPASHRADAVDSRESLQSPQALRTIYGRPLRLG
jgi:hypothetical protein